MVEQNAYAALELSDRSYVLEQGRVTHDRNRGRPAQQPARQERLSRRLSGALQLRRFWRTIAEMRAHPSLGSVKERLSDVVWRSNLAISPSTVWSRQQAPISDALEFSPSLSKELLQENRSWLEPTFLDPATGKLVLCIQATLCKRPSTPS